MFSLWERVNAKNQSSKLKDIIMGYGVVFPDVDFEVQGEGWNQELVLDRIKWTEKGVDVYSRENRRRLERNLPAGIILLEFHDAFIVSVDYAKAIEIKNLILDTEWDIVVIDEAHQVGKPHQSQPNVKIKKDRWYLAVDLSKSLKVKHLITRKGIMDVADSRFSPPLPC
ncbi:MAG TPA: hypothetical protein DDW79_06950 [Anaerolineae bacterium]|nr:hypothetical protein [Anaerolineae bacterium]